jgi:N-acetylglucosamine-6-sulfatase
MKFIHALTWAFAAGVAAAEQQLPLKHGDLRPNIVVILTDDQDLHMNSLSYMPLLKKHITDQGTFYKSHYCTTAICCPSRVTLWTGRNAHNTNVTDVFPPYGKCIAVNKFNHTHMIRWISQIRSSRLELELASTLASSCGVQHLLYGEAFQCSYG